MGSGQKGEWGGRGEERKGRTGTQGRARTVGREGGGRGKDRDGFAGGRRWGPPKPKPRQSSLGDSQLWGAYSFRVRGEGGVSPTRYLKGPLVSV